MSDRTSMSDFPLPDVGHPWPEVWRLKVWKGISTRQQLDYEEIGDLHREWRDEMESAGYILAWFDPATGNIASRT
jgi:hypothetical protein